MVNMKIQYQFKYKKCLKIFLFLCMYLPVQAQSNPKLSYFEHVRNFSDIFQSINNITMVVIGIYTLSQIISHHYVELKSTLCILYHTCTLSNRQLHAIVVLVSWHETVEGQISCTCKLLKPFNGIQHVKITGYTTLMKIYVDKLCKYSKKYCHVLLNIRCIFLMMVLTYSYVYYLYYD